MGSNIISLDNLRMLKAKKKKKKALNLDAVKYYTKQEIRLLRKRARTKSRCGLKTHVREWAIIDTLTSCGLRASECANLRIANLHLSYGKSEILVERGKGDVTGIVQIPESLKKHLKAFLKWKQENRESVNSDAPLFMAQRGQITRQGIYRIVTKYLKELGLYEPGKAVHSLRHSFAVELYQRSGDLLAVKKQLRHRSIQSTLIYADVSREEIQAEIKGMWS